MSVKKYTKECYCCKKVKECICISASSDEKGEPRLICKDCNCIGE